VSHPPIWKNLGLDAHETPFRFDPQDLANVVKAFHHTALATDGNVFDSATDFQYVDKKRKNKLNKLSKEYFEYIQQDSLPLFGRIRAFLQEPRNQSLRSAYHEAADELKQKIITTRQSFDRFDAVLTFLADAVINGNPEVREHGRLVRAFLHYMYFDCDIGRRDVEAN
jgi:hypothetical protein